MASAEAISYSSSSILFQPPGGGFGTSLLRNNGNAQPNKKIAHPILI